MLKMLWVTGKTRALIRAGNDSGNDDESPATGFRPLPGLFNLGERYGFGFDLKRALCAPVHNLLHCGNKNVARWDSGRSEDGQRSASEHRCGKRDVWACTLAHLDQARL